MDFYVSWYPGDPDYPRYDSDCSLLISITSVARDWTVKQLATAPRRLLIDSGGYRFAIAPREALTPKQVLSRQLELLAGMDIPVIVCASDCPVIDPAAGSNTRDQLISQTIAFAYEFKNLIVQKRLPSNVTPMAIVQGYDADSLGFCTHELKQIGFPLYGIGSLAVLRRHEPIMQRVEAVTRVVDASQIHVFGVSGAQTARALRNIGLHSIDSARAAKAAAYNEILYSCPFRRFGIWEASFEFAPIKGRLPLSRRLLTPLPCDCPVCLEDASGIMGVGHRASIRRRTLHNYYHLKQTFCSSEN